MALIVIDECSIGLALTQDQGGSCVCVMRANEIKGFPAGFELMLQLGPETTKAFFETLKEQFEPGPKVDVHTPEDLRKMAEAYGDR